MTQDTRRPEAPRLDICDRFGALLDQAVFHDGVALHGRSSADGLALDHLVASPSGVDVIQIVAAAGRVQLTTAGSRHIERTLRLDERDATRLLLTLDAACGDVADVLGRAGLFPRVRGWLCLHGADFHGSPEHLHLAGYEVVSPDVLVRELSFAGADPLAQVIATIEALESSFPRRLAPDGGVPAVGSLPRPSLPPARRARVLAGAGAGATR